MVSLLNPSDAPVFIVGMNGSGTTMMLDHLGHHPELFGFDVETYILPYYLASESRYGDLREDRNFLRLWNDMRGEYPFRQRNRQQPLALPPDWSSVQRHACAVFDRIIREFARREGKERWCEKTPAYAMHIDRLAAAFPDARFIHMLRDARDCAASDHRRWGRHPEGTAFRWKRRVAEGRNQGSRIPDRYLEIRYEDVTSDPRSYMGRVCEFVCVDFDERVMSASRVRPKNIGTTAKTIVTNRSRGIQYFNDSRLQALEKIAGKQLAVLGYETRFPDGDFNPSNIQRLWWTIHDGCAFLSRQLKDKFTVRKRMKWSLFFARLKAILRSK
jgi:hypothetical protein